MPSSIYRAWLSHGTYDAPSSFTRHGFECRDRWLFERGQSLIGSDRRALGTHATPSGSPVRSRFELYFRAKASVASQAWESSLPPWCWTPRLAPSYVSRPSCCRCRQRDLESQPSTTAFVLKGTHEQEYPKHIFRRPCASRISSRRRLDAWSVSFR